jgi:uncharacterized Zn ribbon protein
MNVKDSNGTLPGDRDTAFINDLKVKGLSTTL